MQRDGQVFDETDSQFHRLEDVLQRYIEGLSLVVDRYERFARGEPS